MSKFSTSALYLMFIAIAAGCQSPPAGAQASVAPEPEPVARSEERYYERRTDKPRVADAQQSAAAVAEIVRLYWQGHDDDALSPIRFVPAAPRPESIGQRILILEDHIVPPSSLLRYRHRVLEFLKVSFESPQRYSTFVPRAEANSRLARISDYLAGLPYHVPVRSLVDLKEMLLPIRTLDLKNDEQLQAHVGVVFDLLADLNPEAQFVLAEIPFAKIPKELFCHFDEDESLPRIEGFLDRSFSSLQQAIQRNGITHVNISYEPSRGSIRANFREFCGRELDWIDGRTVDALLYTYAGFYERLSQVPGAVVFKSLPNSPERWSDPSSESDLLDCTPYANFVRVGFFARANSRLGEEGGAYDRVKAFAGQGGNSRCASVFVNGGFEGDNPELTGRYGPRPLFKRFWGLTFSPEKEGMATSWAAPLALSHSIFLAHAFADEMGRAPTREELLQRLTHGQASWMIDPLLHDQFELNVR
jgi:hypothetical protein